MIPNSIAELDQLRDEAYKMVTLRASASGASSFVPVPGADVAGDVALLMTLIPAITKKFGLSDEQVQSLDPVTRQIIHAAIKKAGSTFVGKVLTKELIMIALKKVGARVAAKSVLKFIPIAGQIASAAIGFGAMKLMGNKHVDECYAVCKRIIEEKNLVMNK
ncbi:hypothetical protein [uncultured Brevibacillus sp.]|uniref:hypothetical protein n=1 Tax=uncultured Brevibacillus sp. TaxID=169970 RepID=UPI0025959240|nr:hypothetical protein [uncultured Brevibacillus sp.]